MNKNFHTLKTSLYFLLTLQLTLPLIAQERLNPKFNRDTLLTAAKNMIEVIPYCTLITLDTTGHPAARIMDPFSPEENMVIWLGTNKNSRKVQEIKKDSRVTLFYEAPNGVGYVLIKGNAYLVDDPLKKKTYWKNEWDKFYTDQKEEYKLIKVVPFRLEILDFKNGIIGDSKSWAVPYVEFK
jgi:general stress protein 26